MVGVELRLVVGPFGHLTSSKPGWILERLKLIVQDEYWARAQDGTQGLRWRFR